MEPIVKATMSFDGDFFTFREGRWHTIPTLVRWYSQRIRGDAHLEDWMVAEAAVALDLDPELALRKCGFSKEGVL